MKNKEGTKVLVLASWYPSRVQQHLGTFVQRHTEAASCHAKMSALFVCADPNIKNTFEIESETIRGVFTLYVYYKKSKNIFLNLFRVFKSYRLGWKKVLSEFGTPHLIHLNILWPAGIFAYYLKKFFGKKYIITENWTGYLDENGSYSKSNRIIKFITKAVAQNAELITPVSKHMQQAMAKHHLGSAFEIVFNVVNTEIFYPSVEPKRTDKTVFLHVSTTLDEQKNVSGLIHAVKKLSEKKMNFELNIVSEKNFSSHEKMAEELGLLNRSVFFKSNMNADGVAGEMRKSHCFVLFSNYENLPVVICEAMASGLPVISSAVGGVPEHITDEFGLLVSPRNIDELCRAMEYMMENKNQYSPARIREYAEKNFSYEAVGEKFYSLYKRYTSAD